MKCSVSNLPFWLVCVVEHGVCRQPLCRFRLLARLHCVHPRGRAGRHRSRRSHQVCREAGGAALPGTVRSRASVTGLAGLVNYPRLVRRGLHAAGAPRALAPSLSAQLCTFGERVAEPPPLLTVCQELDRRQPMELMCITRSNLPPNC